MTKINRILKLADECFACKYPMCSKQGCPIETNIPEFISKIKERNFEEAYYILQENNIMSNICGLICPTEEQCMGKCIKAVKGKPVKINELENFVNEWVKENNIEYKIKCAKKNGKKIAIIGSGPAGITCAIELVKKGFDVTIIEKENQIGGLLRYGIPDFRLSKKIVDNLKKLMKELNIEIKTETKFGTDITIKDLKKEYSATFLGLGANVANTNKFSGKEIHNANEFLKKYNNSDQINKFGNVAVIGGGNVAMDAARACIRIGADKVYILYRRTEKEMSARPIEIENALKDGVEIIYLTKMIDCIYENEKLKEIICIKTKLENNQIIDIKDEKYKMKIDNIIFAIGMIPDKELLKNQGLKFNGDLIEVDKNQMTNIDGIFAGGDLIETRSSVCKAIKMGKTAAKNIEKYINSNL